MTEVMMIIIIVKRIIQIIRLILSSYDSHVSGDKNKNKNKNSYYMQQNTIHKIQ